MPIEQEVQIRTPDGVADGFLYLPEGSSPWPGVLHYTDIGGNRDVNRELSRRIAAEGYVVLMPNVFYRIGRPPLFDFPRVPGEERTVKRFAELRGPLTPEAMDRDARAYVDFLTSQSNVASGPVGVVGYCLTGAMAIRTAALFLDKVAGAASFHGGGLYSHKPESPHHLLPRIKARLYLGHATNDNSMPVEAIAKLEEALKKWGGRYESETYEGARHGWTMSDSSAYNAPQAERAFEALKRLFATTLRASR